MKKPKMILFDYGQTLVNETDFNPLEGTRAVLEKASFVPEGVTAEVVQALANELALETRQLHTASQETNHLEIHINAFQNYLYEYFGIELSLTPAEAEEIFACAALQIKPAPHIEDLLAYLNAAGIRTGVISNITFSGQCLSKIITSQIPYHTFEFILASSEYMFRKPHPRIFEIALRKANLEPEDVWYCGDRPTFDVKGAANAGIFPVLYQGVVVSQEPVDVTTECLVIQDWKSMIDALEQL